MVDILLNKQTNKKKKKKKKKKRSNLSHRDFDLCNSPPLHHKRRVGLVRRFLDTYLRDIFSLLTSTR